MKLQLLNLPFVLASMLPLAVTGYAAGPRTSQRLIAVSVPVEHKSQLARIGFIEPAVPERISIGNPSRPNLGVLGLAPLLIDHAVTSAVVGQRASAFETHAEASHGKITSLLASRLQEGLSKAGSAVTRLSREAGAKKEFLTAHQYLGAHAAVDAYLDVVVVEWGFVPVANGGQTLWMPRVLADVQLVGADGKTVIFSDRLSNLMADWRGGRSTVRAEHGFPTAKQVTENAPRALEGIYAAVVDLCELCSDRLTVQAAPLYIYRTKSGRDRVLSVLLDGKVLCSMRSRQGLCLTVAPGDHTLRFETSNPKEIQFTAETGKATYIKADVKATLTGRVQGVIEPVSVPEGVQAIQAMK